MKINEFVSYLFEVEVVAHIAHLQTTSFAVHSALSGLYENIVGHRDSFIESYQGKYGIITGYKSVNPNEGTDIAKYLITFRSECEQFRLTLDKDGYLQQIIDDIIELVNSTLYKLRFLK